MSTINRRLFQDMVFLNLLQPLASFVDDVHVVMACLCFVLLVLVGCDLVSRIISFFFRNLRFVSSLSVTNYGSPSHLSLYNVHLLQRHQFLYDLVHGQH